MSEFVSQNGEFLAGGMSGISRILPPKETPWAGEMDLSYSTEIPCLATNSLSLSANSLGLPVVFENSGSG
jgi:hypothetical protein